MVEIGAVATENANAIAPLDTGNLRRSAELQVSALSIKIEWTADYASTVYYKNFKNPETKMWAEKDAQKNSSKYAEYLAENTEVYID